jgi:hypothetical protein
MEVQERFGIARRARQGRHAAGRDLSAGRNHLMVASELWESLPEFRVVSAEIAVAGVMESVRVETGL